MGNPSVGKGPEEETIQQQEEYEEVSSVSSSDDKFYAWKHPVKELKDKLENHHLRAEASHFKHKIGKLGNIFNPNHR
jgi:hypothetical protein